MLKLLPKSNSPPCLTRPRRLTSIALIVGALALLFCFTANVHAQAVSRADPFVILLKGIYQPVTYAPDLGLRTVNLNDGSFSKNDIFNVEGLPGSTKHPVGTFYVQFGGMLCAYHLPGGSFTAEFVGADFEIIDDGDGGVYWDGTFELNILEAKGSFSAYAGGHIHMVDVLHLLANGLADEYCFCHVSP